MEKILSTTFFDRHTLERYAPAYIFFQSILFVIGFYFWVAAHYGVAEFSAQTWGHIAYDAGAKFWAGVNMVASAACIAGLIDPIHRKLIILGGAAHIAEYIGLSYSAAFGGGDPAVAIYASALLMSINITMVGGAIASWKKR